MLKNELNWDSLIKMEGFFLEISDFLVIGLATSVRVTIKLKKWGEDQRLGKKLG